MHSSCDLQASQAVLHTPSRQSLLRAGIEIAASQLRGHANDVHKSALLALSEGLVIPQTAEPGSILTDVLQSR